MSTPKGTHSATPTATAPPIPAVAYNTVGMEANACEWNIYMEDLRNIFLNLLRNEIQGIEELTWSHSYVEEPRQRNFYGDARDDYDMFGHPIKEKNERIVIWHVWLDGNGKHFTNGDSSNALGKAMSRYSEELKNFVKKFGYYFADDFYNKSTANLPIEKLMTNNTNYSAGRHLVGIRIATTPLLSIITDRNNYGFTKLTGHNPGQMTTSRRYHFDHRTGEPSLIQIRKEARKLNQRTERPVAKKVKHF